MAGGGEANLESTPTWIVALVCTVIVIISLIVERSLHRLGKWLENREDRLRALYESLLKIKEELMLLGFISLLLVVFQDTLVKICVSPDVMKHWLPCKYDVNTTTVGHFAVGFGGSQRRLLAGGASGVDHCANKGKVPLLSSKAIHDLHIFIFVLAITHVFLTAVTLLLAVARIRQWKHWEDSIQKQALQNQIDQGVNHVQEYEFIQKRYKGFGKDLSVKALLYSFFKQFYSSVSKLDYETMRYGFIQEHIRSKPSFNFYGYMIRALEDDFESVVGISWYFWIYVIAFLLLEIHGWHLYFWVAFIPLVLLLAVGAKLEHVIIKLAHDVAEKHVAFVGPLVVKPSDRYFWFGKPIVVLRLLHFILFQNAFEMAFFFWIWVTYGFHSCIMGKMVYLVPRLVIGVIVQFLLSYSALPLYAIVTQMGSSFKRAIFDKHTQESIHGWAKMVKKKKDSKQSAKVSAPQSGQEQELPLQSKESRGEIIAEP